MKDGWVLKDFPAVNISDTTDWAVAADGNRSWRFHLQAWDFMGPVLSTYDQTREIEYLRWASDVAATWTRQNPEFIDDNDAWYDMAVGQRGYRLAYLLDAARREPSISPETVTVLEDCARTHFVAFSQDSLFAAHSNHGLYFAAGQAALARRLPDFPEAPEHSRIASERLNALLDRQFGEDGVHREHSPAYHLMILEAARGLVDAGLADAATFGRRLQDSESALAWFVTPAASLVQFGDTAVSDLAGWHPDRWHTPSMKAAATQGAAGAAPSENVREFRETGYWVVRDRWPSPGDPAVDATYLAQTAAFHSRVHKHADDLSMVWWDRGAEILVDAGRYGYLGTLAPDDPARKLGFFYSDPKRQFVESTRAHNTVEIDGLDYQRRDKPYGSAIRASGTQNGVSYAFTEALQLKSVLHTRLLVISPGRWLLVYDKLRDTGNTNRTFRQRFNLAPELKVEHTEDSFRVKAPQWSAPLRIKSLASASSLAPVRGGTDPLLGWVSRADRSLEEATATGFEFVDTSYATFATLLSFEDAVAGAEFRPFGGTGGGDFVEVTEADSAIGLNVAAIAHQNYQLTITSD